MTSAPQPSDLRAKRDRLRAEIKEAEGKAQRLREVLEVRKRNLCRLDAELAMSGEEARGL
jgi:hypothetical protein